MIEQSKTDLEKMDEKEVWQFLNGLLSRLDPEEEYDARHPKDYMLEMPQSGERFLGRESVRAFQEAYPTPPASGIRLRRVLVREGLWVVEGGIDYGDGRVSNVALVFELRGGRMWRDRWYFAETIEAPEWRSQWVELMEPAAEPDGSDGKNLRANDEGDVRRLMGGQFEKMRDGDFAGAHEWYDDAVVVEWPQSGERIRGKTNLLALRQAYPADVEFEERRIIARRGLGVGEYVIRYDGRPVYAVAIVEFGDGKVIRETHYFAEPFEAPAWRTQWAERMEL